MRFGDDEVGSVERPAGFAQPQRYRGCRLVCDLVLVYHRVERRGIHQDSDPLQRTISHRISGGRYASARNLCLFSAMSVGPPERAMPMMFPKTFSEAAPESSCSMSAAGSNSGAVTGEST